MKSKLGFHSGPTGSLTGIGNFWQQLDNAGISIFHKSSDSYGPLYEISNLPNPHNAEHHLIYRLSTAGQDDGYDYDVPLYELSPKQAAVLHWQATKAKLPPEFNKQKVWIEVINEVDKNRSDWIGRFSVEIAILANVEGYKVLSPGWSSGEPEPAHWYTAGMLAYLMYCEQFPTMAAVSIHEYDFGLAGYDAVYPYHYGRFQWCFDACDRNNISRPSIYVTEWGWSLNQVPTWNNAIGTIHKINELYCKYPQIKGAAIWNLDGGWGDINNQLLQYMQPLTTYTLQSDFIEGSINEPLDPNYFENTNVYLQNPSFENGWYHVNNIQEIQIPNNYAIWWTDVSGTYETNDNTLQHIGDYIPNPHDTNSWSQFVRYELRVLPKSQLPVEEQNLFVLHGNHTVKIFKGFGAWHGGLKQVVDLNPGTYKLTVKVFADLVIGYNNGQKIWADDPLSGLIRFNDGDFISLTAGEWNILDFDFSADGSTNLKVDFMLPFALNNSGLFMDDWHLEKIENGCDCAAITDVRSTIIWIPQYKNLTAQEKQQIFDWAENGFFLSNGTKTTGEHPITSSHAEALKIHVAGLPNSVLAVAYPGKIGTGVTTDWLNSNCPAVFCDNKQVVFLGEQQFRFDNVPVIYR